MYHSSINCDVCVSVCEREQHVVKIASGDKVVLSSFEAHRGPLKIATPQQMTFLQSLQHSSLVVCELFYVLYFAVAHRQQPSSIHRCTLYVATLQCTNVNAQGRHADHQHSRGPIHNQSDWLSFLAHMTTILELACGGHCTIHEFEQGRGSEALLLHQECSTQTDALHCNLSGGGGLDKTATKRPVAM